MSSDGFKYQDSTADIAIPRVATSELTVHAKDDRGYWHRLHQSTVKTACGKPINYHRAETKPGRRIEHPLAWSCGCWTTEERLEADQNWFEQYGKFPTPDDF